MKHAFDFALTTYCQAKCRSCARTNEHTGEKEDWLPLEHFSIFTFQRLLKRTKLDIEYIQFCGEFGDPMMHPHVLDFIELGLEHTNKIHINTNGGLRQPEWYAELAKKHGDRVRIKFGIDGADHDTNWLYREGVDWQRAMDNMTAWFQNGGSGAWHFLVFDWNWFQVPEIVQMANDIGCKLDIKINKRSWGKITPENEREFWKLAHEHYEF